MKVNVDYRKFVPAAVIVLLLLVLGLNSFVVVAPGHTGVVVTLGKVEEKVMQEGVHFKMPFTQEVIQIDNRITKLEVDTEAFSKDLQTVDTTLAINYRIDKNMSYSIFKDIGSNYEGVLVTPAVNEVLKAIVSRYTAEETVSNRALISKGLLDGLNEKLNPFGLYATDVNIIDFDFSDEFINAIEEKQVAQQKLLKAETEKQTAITIAEAEAETMKIKAQAEAEANRILAESLSDQIIEYSKIEKWDGKLPQVSGASTIIDLSE
ncbi:MAG: prohibitin family protein [Erysipelotrichaceae bacterium]|nr:prohibitin family protein [Erysipelotrichaceae bacterium]